MASAQYHIITKQDNTFVFHIEYYDASGDVVDLTGYTARLQVRPNIQNKYKYLEITTYGVTGGGVTGDFLAGETGNSGVAGSGGISLNTGETGGGFTGGILITADATTMGYVPAGNWCYGLDIIKGVTVSELLTGRFIVEDKVAR